MPNVAVGEVMEITIGYKFAGQQCLMVRHYVCANLPTNPDYETQLALAVGELGLAGNVDLMGALSQCQSTRCTIGFIQAQSIWPTRRFYQRALANAPGSFAGAEDFPPNVAAVVTLQPNVPGRGRSGSAHVGGLTTLAGTNDGTISEEERATLENLATKLTKGFGGAAPNNYWKPVMYHAQDGTVNTIVATTVQETMRVVRRRTVGLGI